MGTTGRGLLPEMVTARGHGQPAAVPASRQPRATLHHPGLLQASPPCPMRETGNLEGSRSLEQRPCGWSHLAGRAHGRLVAEPGPRPRGQSVHGSSTAGEWQCDLLCPHEPQQRPSAPPLIPARICPVHSGACPPHTQGWAGYLSSAPLCSAPGPPAPSGLTWVQTMR